MKTLIAALLLTFSLTSLAAPACFGGTSSQQIDAADFFVSGVLRRNGEDITIKLVHSVEKARSAEAAVDAFMAKVGNEYPGYAILDTLVSRSQADTPALDCHYPPAIKGIAI